MFLATGCLATEYVRTPLKGKRNWKKVHCVAGSARVSTNSVLRHKADYEANVFELHRFLYRCDFFEDCFYII